MGRTGAQRGTVESFAGQGRLITARGSLALEERFLDDLGALISDLARAGEGLDQGVRIIVPSVWLRDHLTLRLLERHGPALLGVTIFTLRGAARDLLDRAARPQRTADSLFGLLARREILREPDLVERLLAYQDGPGLALPALRDLLSAGLSAETASRCEASLQRACQPESRLASALVRSAARTRQAMTDLGVSRGEDLLAQACEQLESVGPSAWPARAVCVYGIDDATGLAGAFVGALMRHLGARVYLDRPDDPVAPGEAAAGAGFGRAYARFLEEIAGCVADERPAPSPELQLFDAAGVDGEVREVALRIRRRLDAGVLPERVAIVARALEPYRVAIRWHLEALAIPFSGERLPRDYDPDQRRDRALVELLRAVRSTPVSLWLETCGPPPSASSEGPEEPDVRRWRDRAREIVDRQALARLEDLLIRDPGDSHRGLIEGLRGQAAATIECLESWPESDEASGHQRRLADLCRTHLHREPPGSSDEALPADLLISRSEYIALLEERLRALDGPEMGGQGGGVRVLAVEHARGLTFDHLFVMGLNRGSFPRPIHEDVLLSDGVRRPIREVLPLLPIKGAGVDEERFLFAKLLSSARHVTLSWQRCDEDGVLAGVSPLVGRLRLAHPTLQYRSVPRWLETAVTGADEGRDDAPMTGEQLLRGLLARRRRGAAGRLLEQILRERSLVAGSGDLFAALDATALARAHLRILDEVDPDLGESDGRRLERQPGPYLGFVGRGVLGAGRGAGAKETTLHVTWLEGLARCPWQSYLTRELDLEPPPDPRPARFIADARMLGDIVHAALCRLVSGQDADRSGAVELERALQSLPVPLQTPGPAEVEQAIGKAMEQVLEQAKVCPPPGVARVLQRRATGFIDAAVAGGVFAGTDSGAAREMLGAEVTGQVPVRVGEASRRLAFRVDRIDIEEGRPVFIDYKTGRCFTKAVKPETRLRDLLAQVRSGRLLQVAVYLRSVTPMPAVGRYWYLGRDSEAGADPCDLQAPSTETEIDQLLDEVLPVLIEAIDRGVMPPRLITTGSEESGVCKSCNVREACWIGDSGIRRRLVNLHEDEERPGSEAHRWADEMRLFTRLLAMDPGRKP